jgi:hypothetical protein
MLLHRLDAEFDVLIQLDAQVSRAIGDVVAIDRTRECFVFQFFPHRPRVHLVDAAIRLHIRAGG